MTIAAPTFNLAKLQTAFESKRAEMRALLSTLLKTPSVSGHEGAFTRLVAEWATAHGFIADVWQADEAGMQGYPEASPSHLPLAGRPTCVIRLPGTGGGRSLMFNAHADVVSAGDEAAWSHGPWAGESEGDIFFGRGACDVKGPLLSALWAMTILAIPEFRPAGDVALELIPGEEDRVGLGTLSSLLRGHRADASIVLEPTEGLPCCASRGGLRFVVTITGRAVHGTVKWLGRDAIAAGRRVLDALQRIESQWNDRSADPLFEVYPIARSITVDAVHGGTWQGMVCDRCTVAGYLELLPRDNSEEWIQRLNDCLQQETAGSDCSFAVSIVETYTGHRLEPASPLCQAAERAHHGSLTWRGFNSGCEAGLRPRLEGTPSLVWGPGSLAYAHAMDERIDFREVADVAVQFGRLAHHWGVADPGDVKS